MWYCMLSRIFFNYNSHFRVRGGGGEVNHIVTVNVSDSVSVTVTVTINVCIVVTVTVDVNSSTRML